MFSVVVKTSCNNSKTKTLARPAPSRPRPRTRPAVPRPRSRPKPAVSSPRPANETKNKCALLTMFGHAAIAAELLTDSGQFGSVRYTLLNQSITLGLQQKAR